MEALKEKPGPQRGRMKMDRWNDDRLDELSRRMDEGFKEMREGFAQMVNREDVKEIIATINARIEQADKEAKERFEQTDREMKEGFKRVDNRFEQVDKRFDRLYYTMITASFGLVASVILAIALG